ncbi:MAG TPA: hypothetical protein VH396_23395 [Chitinophagaceae bacterium]|jgi:hypothetical protein
MKKNIFLLSLLTTMFSYSYSQGNSPNIRLNAYGAYVFDDKVDNGYTYNTSGYFSGTLQGGFLWGGGLEFRLHDYYGLELLYQRLDTHAPVDYWDYGSNRSKSANLKVGINYIMLGGARSLHPNAKAEPYGGFMLGMAIVNTENPEENNSSHSATKFAWGLRGGANIWASERVGIKLQAQLLSVPQGAGGGLYFGTGGAGVGVSTYSTVLQFVLGGGLTFKLGGQAQHTTTTQQ